MSSLDNPQESLPARQQRSADRKFLAGMLAAVGVAGAMATPFVKAKWDEMDKSCQTMSEDGPFVASSEQFSGQPTVQKVQEACAAKEIILNEDDIRAAVAKAIEEGRDVPGSLLVELLESARKK